MMERENMNAPCIGGGGRIRILHEGAVYLPLPDCAKAIGISEDALSVCAAVTRIPYVGACLSEREYNRALLDARPSATAAVEVTSFDTVSESVAALVKMIPLKLMLGGVALSHKAMTEGMTEEDYLWKADLPENIARETKRVLSAKGIREKIQEYALSVEKCVKSTGNIPFKKFGLALQHLCVLRPNSVKIQSFYAGNGIFWETQPDLAKDDAWDLAETLPGGAIRVPSADYKEGRFDLERAVDRDFRNYTASENVLWCLQNLPSAQEWTDTLTVRKGGVCVSVDMEFIALAISKANQGGAYVFDSLPRLAALDGNRGRG